MVFYKTFIGCATGCRDARVPWLLLENEWRVFIKEEYFPEGLEVIRDPSRMNNHQVEEFIDHWNKRSEDGEKFVFKFSHCLDDNDDMVVALYRLVTQKTISVNRKHKSHKSVKHSHGKKKARKNDSSDSDLSTDSSNSHETLDSGLDICRWSGVKSGDDESE